MVAMVVALMMMVMMNDDEKDDNDDDFDNDYNDGLEYESYRAIDLQENSTYRYRSLRIRIESLAQTEGERTSR